MDWIFLRISKDELVFRLCRQEKTDRLVRRTIAHVEEAAALWRVVETTARMDGSFGLKAGESLRTIECDLIRRDEDSGELGFYTIPELESPPFHSCPLHFLDMVPEGRSPQWRQSVRDYHATIARDLEAFQHGAAVTAIAAAKPASEGTF